MDLHGHGGTPAWQATGRMQLEDDAALVEPLLAAPGGVHWSATPTEAHSR